MTSNTRHDPLAELSAQGVAVWLDDLSRELLTSGELQAYEEVIASQRGDSSAPQISHFHQPDFGRGPRVGGVQPAVTAVSTDPGHHVRLE